MKRIISIAFAAIFAIIAISCQKEESVSEMTDAVQYTFNISVNEQLGFDNAASTKGGPAPSYKTEWESGDKIFLFFKPTDGSLLDDTYATLKYNGSSWDGEISGPSSLGEEGILSAVYVYKLVSVTPEFTDGQWTIATGNTFYNCHAEVSYTVSGGQISASLSLEAPADFVQFYVYGTSGAPMTCDKVKGWKDVAVGSDMTIGNVICTGYMDGLVNSGNSAYREYYGRIVSGTSLEGVTCSFSMAVNGKVREHTAIPTTATRSFKMSASAADWTEVSVELPGLFTVAPGKPVRFSKGNLYWDGDSFEFEASQYDYPTTWSTSHVGHFNWSKDASVAYAGSYSESGTNGSDVFFTNATVTTAKSDFTVNGVTGKYRTLSTAEWTYLFQTRANATDLYKIGVTVCGQTNCVILAPDGFNKTLASSYDVSAWSEAEADGLVCLPAASYRDGTTIKGYFGSKGYYWSSSASSWGSAYYMGFPGGSSLELNAGDYRYFGESVRLVADINQ